MRLVIILGAFLFSVSVFASFLRISSESNLFFAEKNGKMFLQGNFTLENQGDESAKEVFPELTIDKWSLALPRQFLNRGQKFTWKVDEMVPPEALCTKVSPGCLLALPSRGDFRIRVDKKYQDQNGYPFSVPDILSLSYKKTGSLNTGFELVHTELNVIAENEVQYRADYIIRSQVDRPLKLALHYLLPKEVEQVTPDIPVELAAKAELRGSFIFRNKSGLVGSDYLTFFVTEVADGKHRMFAWSPARFKIQKFIPPQKRWQINLSPGWYFACFWSVLTIIAALWVNFYWERPRKK